MVAFFFLRIGVEIFRWIPFSALPYLSNVLAFALCWVFRYRRGVVLEGLSHTFPEKSASEIRAIAWKSYQNLGDVMLETLKSFSAPLSEIQRRCPCVNPELVNQYLTQGQSVLITGSHYNNWELACLTIPAGFHAAAVTVYKPLTNRVIDKYYNQNRARGGTLLAAMDEVFAMMRRRRQEPSAFLFLSDQSPSSRKSSQWVSFLGRETAFLPGVDVLARKFNYPVLHFKIERIQRGYYQLRYYELFPTPAQASEKDITVAYANIIEAEIRDQPENWLWTHKRWKMKPD